MRALVVGAVVAVTQGGEPVGCAGSDDAGVEVRWTGPGASIEGATKSLGHLGEGDSLGQFGVKLHGCRDWDVETFDDHLVVDAGWTSCAVSGFVRDGALVVESEAFPIDGDESVTLDFSRLPAGAIGGMGAEVVALRGGVFLRHVRPSHPAEMAGLREGDRVVAVDGWPTTNISTREFVRLATGEPGTPVELEVIRGGEPTTVRLTRERIPSGR